MAKKVHWDKYVVKNCYALETNVNTEKTKIQTFPWNRKAGIEKSKSQNKLFVIVPLIYFLFSSFPVQLLSLYTLFSL